MKVLLINGSPHENGCTHRALKEITKEFEKEGIDFEIVHIGKKGIQGCTACAVCKSSEDQHCIFNDDIVNETIDKMKIADALIVGSPVYYANVAGNLRTFLDRMFYAGRCFENKPAAAVVNCRRGGASATFAQINHYFTISNMLVVGSQYWNQTHGNKVEELEQDLEGLQTMRTLGKNMSWILKCIEAGKEKGVKLPEREVWQRTNFIQ